ncbi:TerC family protein [Frateuria aurantia]
MFTFDWLSDPTAWAGLLTLIVLEIVLGIDNLVFVAILTDKLRVGQRDRARILGLSMALLMRLVMLSAMSWLVQLTAPVVSWHGLALSWRDIALVLGGLFLLLKSTLELHERIEADESHQGKAGVDAKFWLVVLQVVALDAVFSLDSVITAVGMSEHLSMMMLAVVLAMILMIFASKPLANFVNSRPTVVILCLSFLLMIGLSLVAEGLGYTIPKGYLYSAIGFSILIEAFNQAMRRNRRRSLLAGARSLRDRTSLAVLRLLGVGHVRDSGDGEVEHEPEAPPVFGKDELGMVREVLDLAQRPVRSIMTPRTGISWLDPSDPPARQLEEVKASPHQWLPVAEGDLDRLLGIASVRDLLGQLLDAHATELSPVLRKPLSVPASMSVLRLIEVFRNAALQVALVVDEYGSVLGLVTPSDILACIAGGFADPDDNAAGGAQQSDDGSWQVDASLDLRRFEQLSGHALSKDGAADFSSLAGYLLQHLGRLPVVGDRLTAGGLLFEVLTMHGARIQRLRITPLSADDAAFAAQESG